MQKQEFETRTPFLDETDHENYEEWFEPAYMGARTIDKDDFCAMLKNKAARNFAKSVSEEFRANEAAMKDLANGLAYEKECNRAMRSKIEDLLKSITLIQATCDRAVA